VFVVWHGITSMEERFLARPFTKGVSEMAKIVWRYRLTNQEQQLWEREELRGWRAAMTGFVEDEARDRGCLKFAIYSTDEVLILKDSVTRDHEESAED